MRRIVSGLPILLGLLVLASGSQTWIRAAEGSGTGTELFGWLWLPPLLSGIALLFLRYSRVARNVVATIVALLQLGFSLIILYYDWPTSKPIIAKVSAHSGVELEMLSAVEVELWPFIASVLLAISGVLVFLISLRWRAANRELLANGAVQFDTQQLAETDARAMWDAQSD